MASDALTNAAEILGIISGLLFLILFFGYIMYQIWKKQVAFPTFQTGSLVIHG